MKRNPPRLGGGRLRTSLLARTNVVLAFSAVAIAATALAALQVFVLGPMTERSADDEAGLVVLSAQTWAELPDYTDARPAFELEMARMHDLVISSDIRDLPPAAADNDYHALLRARISERLGAPVRLLEGDELVWAELPIPGGRLQIGFAPGQQDDQLPYVGLIIGIVGAGIVLVTSSLVVRRIAQPLAETAGAVEAFRGAEGFSPLPEKGPRELVTLAESFNRMAREISTLLSSRTTLLAGISHDLRTPLARMRLAVELLPDDVDPKLVARMEGNLERMDELIGDALRFARGAGAGAPGKVVSN
ncbi:MAG: HAMP domain-containing protein [Gammaproteobacteria bacterium]|nr:HAMP domain-containing protein [Gammaproteobacteria bacterium]